MGTKGEQFAGLAVALVTPFKDGEVDYELFQQQIEFQISAGTNMLCPVGTTGESPTLSHEEHEKVIAFVCDTVAGRVKVMPGTGSNSTAEALRLTKFAEKVGADAALAGRSLTTTSLPNKGSMNTSSVWPKKQAFLSVFTTSLDVLVKTSSPTQLLDWRNWRTSIL